MDKVFQTEKEWEEAWGMKGLSYRPTAKELFDSGMHPLQLTNYTDGGVPLEPVTFGDVVDFELELCCEEVVNNPELRAHIFGV